MACLHYVILGGTWQLNVEHAYWQTFIPTQYYVLPEFLFITKATDLEVSTLGWQGVAYIIFMLTSIMLRNANIHHP